jgi:uncharacterized protein YjbI with pentapeptide repeats
MPSGGREIVDQDHRAARIGDLLKRRQLGELLRVANAGARAIGEDLSEWEVERLGDGLGDLLAEAIRPARMAARDAGDRIGSSIAAELTDKSSDQFGCTVDEPTVEFSLRAFQRRDVVSFGTGAPSACGDPCDFVAAENHRPIDERAQQPRLALRALDLGSAGAECRRAEFDEARQAWRGVKREAPGRQGPPEGFDISDTAGGHRSIFGSRVSRRAREQYRKLGFGAMLRVRSGQQRSAKHARVRRMNKQETLDLYGRAEAARSDALAKGADPLLAHAAATDVWNAWANDRIAERKALEASGDWIPGAFNTKTITWTTDARVVFSNRYEEHVFNVAVDCRGWLFPGIVSFENATFSKEAKFTQAIFSNDANFQRAKFEKDVDFREVRFASAAQFGGYPTFSGNADFSDAVFSGRVLFGPATFKRDALFSRAKFSSFVIFDRATFGGTARFNECSFEGLTSFPGARFRSDANFTAIRAERAFVLGNATFKRAPDFIQAHFEEAPGFDVAHFTASELRLILIRRSIGGIRILWKRLFRAREQQFVRFIYGQGNPSARYRALRRLAAQGHDHDREQMFFASEIRASRMVTDFPFPWPFWRKTGWSGSARYWFGLLYQVFSNFGRSTFRPIVFWLATIALAAVYFLGHSEMMENRRAALRPKGLADNIKIYAITTMNAFRTGVDCFTGPSAGDRSISQDHDSLYGLPEPIRADTNAITEAIQLALRNSLVVVDSGAEGASRTLGCLYGIERYGTSRAPYIPSAVSFACAIQKLFSVVFIFLFGLALRNMLRVK